MAVAGVVGTYATESVESAVKNAVIRDISVPLIWLALILGLPWVVTRRWPPMESMIDDLPPRQGSRPVEVEHGPSESLDAEPDQFLEAVTGDTVIRDVAGNWCHFYYLNVWEFDNLTLAEMALIRRMAACPGASDLAACEAILIAAGVTSASASLVRLRGQEMFDPWAGNTKVLSEKAVRSAEEFTAWLTYDPRLVAAYRKVTTRIDQTIRFDGQSLLPREVESPTWRRGPDFEGPGC